MLNYRSNRSKAGASRPSRLQKSKTPAPRTRSKTNSSTTTIETFPQEKERERPHTMFFKKKKSKGRKSAGKERKTAFPAFSSRRQNKKPQSPKKANDIHSEWSFSVESLSNDGLRDAAVEMITEAYNKLTTFCSSKSSRRERGEDVSRVILDFVERVEESYFDSAFHNFKHAVDVTQLMYCLITSYFYKRLRPEDMFYLLVATLCHDIFHPGVSYGFLKKHGYLRDHDSLEDYHIKKTIDLINDEDMKLFQEPFLSAKQKLDLIDYATHLISATNIAKHDYYIKQADTGGYLRNEGFLRKEQLAILIKISDLANIARDFEDSWQWSIKFKVETGAEREIKNINSKKESLVDLTNRLIMKQNELIKKYKEEQSLSIGTSETTLNFMNIFAKRLVSCLRDLRLEAGFIYGKRFRDNQEKWSSFKRNETQPAISTTRV